MQEQKYSSSKFANTHQHRSSPLHTAATQPTYNITMLRRSLNVGASLLEQFLEGLVIRIEGGFGSRLPTFEAAVGMP